MKVVLERNKEEKRKEKKDKERKIKREKKGSMHTSASRTRTQNHFHPNYQVCRQGNFYEKLPFVFQRKTKNAGIGKRKEEAIGGRKRRKIGQGWIGNGEENKS